MKKIFERHVPLSVKRTARKKPWFTKDLCNLRKRKIEAAKDWKRRENECMINENIGDCMCKTLKERFDSSREDYRNMHECCYQEYVGCVDGMKNDPKKFFEFVDMKNKCVRYPSSMYFAAE
jgi:hypothetical protein